MKIVILADPLDNQYAGIHVYTKELVGALAEADKQNEYILIRQKKADDFPSLKQIIVPNLPLWTGFQVIRFFVIFPWIIRRLHADVVVEPAHFGPFNLPEKIKRITVIHDLTPIRFPEYHRWYSQTLQRIFLKRILQKAKMIITNSNNTSKDVDDFIPGIKNKTERIYLGKESLFKPEHLEKVIRKYSLNTQYFLFTGTLEPRKNLLVLLRAYTIFCQKSKKPVSLFLVGKTGWKANPVFDELARHPYRTDIHQLGYVERDELPTIYSQATAFIYPSLYEGFGLPVLEAMACGTACIVSDSSSLPEVGGNAVVYFPPTDQEALADRMIHLADDISLRKGLEEKSLLQAGKFSWKSYAEKFMKIIDKLN